MRAGRVGGWARYHRNSYGGTTVTAGLTYPSSMYAALKAAARARTARKGRPHHSRVALGWLGLPWPKPLGKVARFQKPIVRDGDYERVEVKVYSLHDLVCDKQAIKEMCNMRLMEGRDGAELLRTLPLKDTPRVEHAYLHELGKEVPTHSPSMLSLPLPREAPSDVRSLPPLLDVFLTTLTRAQHILITDMVASVGTCWSKNGSGAQDVRWTGSVAAVFAVLSELPPFVPVHGDGEGLLQVTLAGHESLLRDLPVYSFRVAQVLRNSTPSARIDVLVWLGKHRQGALRLLQERLAFPPPRRAGRDRAARERAGRGGPRGARLPRGPGLCHFGLGRPARVLAMRCGAGGNVLQR